MNAVSSPQGRIRVPVRAAATLGFLGVALGAFGAHGLEGTFEAQAIDPAVALERMDWWKTAAFYHLIHAVALAAGAACCALTDRSAKPLTICMVLGVTIFSGTLYAMALGAPRWFGAITPLGGLLLMAGWTTLFLSTRPPSPNP